MNPHPHLRWLLAACLLPVAICVQGQSPADRLAQARETLLGQPLYLRGFWMGDKLDFDEAGHLVGTSPAGPFTLCGMDVKSVSTQGKNLLLHGERVALVADPEGFLTRKAVINSKTRIVGTLRRSPNNVFIAKDEFAIVVHPDASGSFEAALKAIFANGFAELAPIVPKYWRCYAEGYLASGAVPAEAQNVVSACVKRRSLSIVDAKVGSPDDEFTPPRVLTSTDPQFTAAAAELNASGEIQVHLTVSRNGIPVGFQVVRAVGAGMEEQMLKAVYDYHFQAATRGATPVAADFDVTMTVRGQ